MSKLKMLLNINVQFSFLDWIVGTPIYNFSSTPCFDFNLFVGYLCPMFTMITYYVVRTIVHNIIIIY